MGIFEDRSASIREVLDLMPSGIAFLDQDSKILDINRDLEILTGYGRDELIGQDATVLVPKWNQDEHATASREVTRDPSGWQKWRNRSLSIKCKDDSELSVEFALSPLILDGQQLVLLVIRDNSAQMDAETARIIALDHANAVQAAASSALAESEQRFRLAFEDNMAPMVFSDGDGLIQAVNDAFCEIVGRNRDELIGNDSSIFTLPDDVGISNEVYRRINSGEIDHLRYVKHLLHQNGRVVDVEVSISPARDENGQTLYFVSSVRDCTDQVRNNRIFSVLGAVNRHAITASDEVEILQKLCSALVDEGGYALAWIGMTSSDREGDVNILCAAGATDYLFDGIVSTTASEPSGVGPTGTALRTGETRAVNDLSNDELYGSWRERATQFGFGSSIAIPSRLDLPSGVLSVYSHDRFAFEELVTEGLKEIVLQTEMAVAHVRSVRETKTALEETAAAINTLRETEQRFRLAFEDNMAPMIFSDLEDRAIAVNDAFCQMVGFTREELLGHDSTQFTYPDDVGITEESHLRLASGEIGQVRYVKRYQRKDGRVVVSEVSRSAARDDTGKVLYFVASERDITEERTLATQLSHQALHDPLTGLANRTLFEDRLFQAHARAVRQGGMGAVLLLDLDDFKGVNDTHGHLVGDQLLVGIARRFEMVTRSSDTLCRFGGDEFLYLAEGLTSPDEAEEVAKRLLDVLAEPFTFGGLHLEQHASIGVVIWDETNVDSAEIVQDADVAQYEAKRQNKGSYAVFTPGMHQQATSRFALAQELRHALQSGELSMHYQPIVELATTEIVGFEALMRWNHPERGWVPPSVFIPLAEMSTLIVELGSFALHEAVNAASSWTQARGRSSRPYVTVNLSAHQFREAGLVSMIEETLARSALGPERLVIEITEGVALLDIAETISVMDRLNRLGVGIALDDFGTGFSSLSYLAALDPRIIKIDQSFVRPSHESARNDTLLETIISLGNKLDVTMLAEGIETQAQLDLLRHFGCGLGQGFLFSPAVPADEAAAMVGRVFGN